MSDTTLNEVSGLELVQIEINGKRYKAKRPDLTAIWGLMEQMVKDDVYTDIYGMADKALNDKGEVLTGMYRMMFIGELFKHIPRGHQMENLSAGKMQTVEGMIAILKSVIVTDEELDVSEIVLSDIQGAMAAVEILCSVPGQEKNAEGVKA